MVKIRYVLIFVVTFAVVMLVLTPAYSITSSDITLIDVHEVNLSRPHGLFNLAFDGESIYYVNVSNEGNFNIIKFDLDLNVLETYDLGLSSNNYERFGSQIETNGDIAYILLKNNTNWYKLFTYDFNDNSLVEEISFPMENISGDIIGVELVEGNFYIASEVYTSSYYDCGGLFKPDAVNVTLFLYKVDLEAKKIFKIKSLSSGEYNFVTRVSSFTFLKDEFVFGTYNMGLYTVDGALLRNLTTAGDIPEFQAPNGYNVTFKEDYLEVMDSSPNNDKLLISVSRYAMLESDGTEQDVFKLFLLAYNIGGASASSGESQIETPYVPNVSEPVTSSSIVVSTTSAVIVTVATGAVASTTSAGSVATGAAATTAIAGSAISSSVAVGSLDANRIFGKYGRYGANLGKYALKLFRRKKKGEGEEEIMFEKPSLIKFMLYLAILSGSITGAFMLVGSRVLSDLILAASTLLTGIGFAFGGFGLLTGYLFIRGIKIGVLPEATRFVKLSLLGSIIGGLYGIATSGIKLVGAFGFVVIVVLLLLLVISVAFSYAAYMLTIGIYSDKIER